MHRPNTAFSSSLCKANRGPQPSIAALGVALVLLLFLQPALAGPPFAGNGPGSHGPGSGVGGGQGTGPGAGHLPPDVPTPTAPAPPGAAHPTGPRPVGQPVAVVCPDGSLTLSSTEARDLALRAVAVIDAPRITTAVVDRAGRILAVYRQDAADDTLDDRAVGLARTGAFFSNNQAPLSSRTVRFVSGVHFPPGVARTPNAALYGIENTNRGCDLNVSFNPQKTVPPALKVAGGDCDTVCYTGCGTGPVTGKPGPADGLPATGPAAVAVDPGGLPVYRGGRLVGGIGVAGLPAAQAEFAAFSAFSGALSPIPANLAPPRVVFIDGIRLPFVNQGTRPAGTAPGAPRGAFHVTPLAGHCAPEGYLVGPVGNPAINRTEVERVVNQAIAAANRTRAVIRLPPGARSKMVIAVGDLDGEILALYRMADATVFSIDVAVAKARNVAYFSRVGLPGVPPGTAITNRTISFAAQPLYPAGIDGTAPGPFFQLFLDDRANPCSQGAQPRNPNQNGIVFFPGSIPLYRGRNLIGGLGISGDGVEQDDYVSFLGADGFAPPNDLWADRIFVRGVRLPFLKFPRNPED